MSVVIDGATYKTTGPSTMKIALGTSYDTVVLAAKVEKLGITATLEGTATLKKGSFHSSVLTHPAPFQPTPTGFDSGCHRQWSGK
jgi:3-deoxy-D-manno-octulosonate 8-phosphate phosphatase KdsC-like HAD superfamily phosphatase